MKRVYLETFGCQMNVSDSERVATLLAAEGYEITPSEDAADVVLLNTCSIREKAEHKLFTRIGQIRRSAVAFSSAEQQNLKTLKNSRKPRKPRKPKNPIIGVLGCVAQLEGETLFTRSPEIDFVIGTKAVGRVAAAIDKVLDGEKRFADLNDREKDYDWTVSGNHRHSPYVGFVPIIEGCNKFCTYCIVPFSRGREKSLPASEIIRQIKILQAQGVREVHLIGQNVNSYRPLSEEGLEGFSGATAFSRLLRAAAATNIERIKFNTSFPRDFHADIVRAIEENENLCNWVHLPVQSGSSEILRSMRRGHTIESYFEKIDAIKSSSRNISLTTDIIVGFPNETDENFQDTLKMAERCDFDAAYLFKYSPRPGTPAFQMNDIIPETVKTERFLELEKILRRSQSRALKRHLNKKIAVLCERISTRDAFEITGHTACHKIVNFKGSEGLLGSLVDVKITECKTNTLYGEIC